MAAVTFAAIVLTALLGAALLISPLRPFSGAPSLRSVGVLPGGSVVSDVLLMGIDDEAGDSAYLPRAQQQQLRLGGAPRAGVAPRPWLSAPTDAAAALWEDADARQAHFWGCLDSALDAGPGAAACRPHPRAAAAVLPLAEWKRHTADVLEATRRFRGLRPYTYFNAKFNASRYDGPWVENLFISAFLGGGKLEQFYPLVPLFVQWQDTLQGDAALSTELRAMLAPGPASLLRPDVLYATVMQGDRLIAPQLALPCEALRNVLVFSGAGHGSVPIPLIKGFHLPHNHHYWPPETDPVTYHARKKVLSFAGDEKGKGGGMLRAALSHASLPADSLLIYPAEKWQWLAHGSVFAVAQQRGQADRATFRTAESLQYGRIVLSVYDDGDVPGTPYQHAADFLAPRDAPGGPAGRVPSGAAALPASYNAQAYGGRPTTRVRDAAATPDLLLHNASTATYSSNSSSSGLRTAGDPSMWTRVLNDGGRWGPGGIGFAVSYGELPAFMCVACQFVLPGSAAAWRGVRTLPLWRYGTGAGQTCPCTAAAWAVAGTSVGKLSEMKLPTDSLAYEMERRVLGVAADYFTYEAVMRHIESYLLAPAGSATALKCVPRPREQAAPAAAAAP